MTIALITGGSRGLGRSIALHLADKGTDVVITYQSNKAAADEVVAAVVAKGRKAIALPLDVAQHGTFDAFAGALGQALQQHWNRADFDYLVNNGGSGLQALIPETTPEQFDEMMNIHLKGPYFLTQKLLPLVKDGGRIVNISTGLARFTHPGSSAYAMMKGGLEVFTRYLAVELGRRGIAANTIAPGAIETDFRGGAVRDNPEIKKMIAGMTALGRVGLPDDIGAVVASLLSDDNRWINGQRIEASGGMHL